AWAVENIRGGARSRVKAVLEPNPLLLAGRKGVCCLFASSGAIEGARQLSDLKGGAHAWRGYTPEVRLLGYLSNHTAR
ncbi:hypothetical protein U1Q18_014592, partial [Sarracenia purpurea var. burkii]